MEYNKSEGQAATDVQAALWQLMEDTGDTEYMPATMDVSAADDSGVLHPLTAREYVSFQTEYLSLYWDYAGGILNNKNLSETEKAVGMREAKAYASKTAKAKALGRLGVKTEDTVKYDAAAATGLDADEILLYEVYRSTRYDKDGNGSTTQEEAQKAIRAIPDLTRAERAYLWQSTNKSWKSESNPWGHS